VAEPLTHAKSNLTHGQMHVVKVRLPLLSGNLTFTKCICWLPSVACWSRPDQHARPPVSCSSG